LNLTNKLAEIIILNHRVLRVDFPFFSYSIFTPSLITLVGGGGGGGGVFFPLV
jgi:hypothetical protein